MGLGSEYIGVIFIFLGESLGFSGWLNGVNFILLLGLEVVYLCLGVGKWVYLCYWV